MFLANQSFHNRVLKCPDLQANQRGKMLISCFVSFSYPKVANLSTLATLLPTFVMSLSKTNTRCEPCDWPCGLPCGGANGVEVFGLKPCGGGVPPPAPLKPAGRIAEAAPFDARLKLVFRIAATRAKPAAIATPAATAARIGADGSGIVN